jgi:hypothetical protein
MTRWKIPLFASLWQQARITLAQTVVQIGFVERAAYQRDNDKFGTGVGILLLVVDLTSFARCYSGY